MPNEASNNEASPAKQQKSTNPAGSDETAIIAVNKYIVRVNVWVVLDFARFFEMGNRVPKSVALLKERGSVCRRHQADKIPFLLGADSGINKGNVGRPPTFRLELELGFSATPIE